MTQMKSLFDFLVEAELSQYHKQFLEELKVTSVSQVKDVTDVDLLEIGMTKPEIRRLNKLFRKYYHRGAISKIKEILIRGQEELNVSLVRSGASKSQLAVAVETNTPVIDAECVTLHGSLGEGEFGNVFQATWKSDSGIKVQVAAKIVKNCQLSASVSRFLQLIFEYQRIKHENIIRLFGVVLNTDSIMLVMELASMKSLFTCLSSQSSRVNYPVFTLCDFALQVAIGMEFLQTKGLLHQDLSSRNVLVFAGGKVKVSDAGLARAMGHGMEYYQRNVSFNLKLPVAWCAPECIEAEEFSLASDVWAYAVTLWEMFSYGFQPWAGFTGNQIRAAVGLAGGSQRLDQPDPCPSDFYKLMLRCWQHSPASRPNFSRIVAAVKEMKPVRMQVFDERTPIRSDCLCCRMNDTITVLGKMPANPPVDGMWKGVLESSGRIGFFDPLCAMPLAEGRNSDWLQKSKLLRRYSSRRSFHSDSTRRSFHLEKRLHSGMISRPQNDLRHVSHVGYDGAVFGDVSFVGQNYDRLPFKVQTPERNEADLCLSTRSLTMEDFLPGNQSFASISSDGLLPKTSLDISPGTSVNVSPGTSLVLAEKPASVSFDFPPSYSRQDSSPSVQQTDMSTANVSADDFNIPDMLSTIDLDLNILDEMMKSFGNLEESDHFGAGQMLPLLEFEEQESIICDGKHSSLSKDDGASGFSSSAFPLVTWSSDMPVTKESRNVFPVVSQPGPASQLKDPSSFSSAGRVKELSLDLPICDSTTRNEGGPPFSQRRLHFELSDPGISSKSLDVGDGSYVEGGASGGGGVLSKIGQALSKRHETRMKRSLQNQLPSSSSSSAEFLPATERLSSRGQKTTSTSLPRDSSLKSSDDSNVVEVRRPMSFLREGRSFSRTKAKIKSSVSSVINGKGSTKKDQPANININLQFFDRLREQELEKVKQEEELELKDPRGEAAEDPEKGNKKAKQVDYIVRPLGLRTTNFDLVSDSQADEGIQISHFLPNVQTGCNKFLETHDSSHDSEQSSVTQQSDDGIYADDSELDSPEGRAVRFSPSVLDSCPAFCSVSHEHVGPGVAVTSDSMGKTTDAELGCVLRESSDLEEAASNKVQLVDRMQLRNHVGDNICADDNISDTTGQMHMDYVVGDEQGTPERCQKALVLCTLDLNDSSRYLTAHPEDQDSPEYVHV